MQCSNFNPQEIKTSAKVKKFYMLLAKGERYMETWSDTIDAFDREIKNTMQTKITAEKVRRELERKHQGTICEHAQCSAECVVRQCQTNMNNNQGRWYIGCPVGKSKDGHTFKWIDTSPQNQPPSSNATPSRIPNPYNPYNSKSPAWNRRY